VVQAELDVERLFRVLCHVFNYHNQ
jgi:hypothetical protein